jgi:hypothetical protein
MKGIIQATRRVFLYKWKGGNGCRKKDKTPLGAGEVFKYNLADPISHSQTNCDRWLSPQSTLPERILFFISVLKFLRQATFIFFFLFSSLIHIRQRPSEGRRGGRWKKSKRVLEF